MQVLLSLFSWLDMLFSRWFLARGNYLFLVCFLICKHILHSKKFIPWSNRTNTWGFVAPRTGRLRQTQRNQTLNLDKTGRSNCVLVLNLFIVWLKTFWLYLDILFLVHWWLLLSETWFNIFIRMSALLFNWIRLVPWLWSSMWLRLRILFRLFNLTVQNLFRNLVKLE